LEAAQIDADNGNRRAWHDLVDEVVWNVRTRGAVEAARNEARSFLRRAVEALASLPDNSYRRALQGICEFTVQRTH
jgi:geranylgeranyl pyrophosphate synthase